MAEAEVILRPAYRAFNARDVEAGVPCAPASPSETRTAQSVAGTAAARPQRASQVNCQEARSCMEAVTAYRAEIQSVERFPVIGGRSVQSMPAASRASAKSQQYTARMIFPSRKKKAAAIGVSNDIPGSFPRVT